MWISKHKNCEKVGRVEKEILMLQFYAWLEGDIVPDRTI